MRPELELIKKIEEFLNGTLPQTDRIDFEKELAGNPQLRESVNIQRQLMAGIERALLGQDIVRARFRFKWLRRLYRGGLGAVLVVATCFLLVHFIAHKATYEGENPPLYNESGQKNWASADSSVLAQTYFIDVSKDTVIETRGGIVFSIPANCFLTKDGQQVSGRVELSVKEALDPMTIMKAGLSTKSGNDLLETGGMFFIDARKDGEPLTINPVAGVYAQISTDSVRAGMRLFHGVRLANGGIDWVKPKPIDHDLVPIDIKSLNFYPPHYLDSLAKWGYDATNKKFTDSLYYSLAAAPGSLSEPATPVLLSKLDRVEKGRLHDTIDPFDMCAVNPS
jgi:hypothetical protein